MMKLIAAVSENWGIGKDGGLLFGIKEDMRFFRETTTGNTVVMGRKTLDSFPGGKPLKNRTNLVFTRDENFRREGVTPVRSAADIERFAQGDVFVIGGGEIYAMLLPYCDCAYITKVRAKAQADTFLENLDDSPEWTLAEESPEKNENGVSFTFAKYVRK